MRKAKATVKVGVIGPKASAAKTEGKGLTVVEVASFHEFGLGVPKRSFIAGYVDENEADLRKRMRKAGELVAKGSHTLEQALELFGLYVVGGMQDRISDNIPPALAESTKKRKGSSVALINTGQLRSSITHEVDTGGRRG
jgi:hypothetical protein